MSTPKSIVRQIGIKRLASKLGVVETAIINALKDGKLKAHWYEVIQAECAELGIDCPMRAFNFKKPAPIKKMARDASPQDISA